MTLESGTDLTEGLELLNWEESSFSEDCVKRRSGVTLGEYQSVPVGHGGVLGVNFHAVHVKISECVSNGKGSAGVSCLGSVYALDHSHSDLCCSDLKLLFQ